jgi:ribonuclease T1
MGVVLAGSIAGAATAGESALLSGAVNRNGQSVQGGAGPGAVALSSLPAEARETKALILRGGPFPYRKDGTVFFNRERLLPPNARGYYREYTVRTPGAADRGARRIVCGGAEPSQPDACYYTADHYASFSRILQ